MADGLGKLNRSNIQEGRTVDPYKTEVGEFGGQALDRVTADVFSGAHADCHVVAIRLDILDLLNIEWIQALLPLTDQQLWASC